MRKAKVLSILYVVVVLLAVSITAEAQQPKKVPRIAFLAGGSRSGDSLLIETFWQRMKELGDIEGKNMLLSTVLLRERLNGSQTSRRNWCVSM